MDPLAGIEGGSQEVIAVRVGFEVDIVEGTVVGTAVGIAGTLESLAGWWW